MADLSVTAANVVKGTDAVIEHGIAGETITAGQPVYLDTTTNKLKLADCNSATAAVRQPRGIALNGASDGQPLTIQRSGNITIGATLTPGASYYLSATAGGIAPFADLVTGDYFVLIGIAKTAAILTLALNYTGTAAA